MEGIFCFPTEPYGSFGLQSIVFGEGITLANMLMAATE